MISSSTIDARRSASRIQARQERLRTEAECAQRLAAELADLSPDAQERRLRALAKALRVEAIQRFGIAFLASLFGRCASSEIEAAAKTTNAELERVFGRGGRH